MEIVLGVKRELIEDILKTEYGFINRTDNYDFIKNNLTAKDRILAEVDTTFKQVIPYLYIECEGEVLLYKRTKKQTEARLHEKLSLGIGGHINPIDEVENSDTINLCLKRELEEEIGVNLEDEPEFMGFINDDLSEVGQVHLGLVFKATSKSKHFEVRETEKMKCEWASKPYINENFERLESWSQIVYGSLINKYIEN